MISKATATFKGKTNTVKANSHQIKDNGCMPQYPGANYEMNNDISRPFVIKLKEGEYY